MNTPPKIQTFDDLREAVYAFRLPKIILTAMDLDLFTILGQKSWTIPALAKALRGDPRGVEILCRNLASAGLLEKKGTRYGNGKLGRTILNGNSPDYRGASIKLMQQQWDNIAQLTNTVRTGKPVEEKGSDSPESRRSFSWAMHQRSLRPAKEVAQQVAFKHARSLLDLGGGPGTYALQFLAHNPNLRATVMDREAVLEVAKEIAAASKHGSRMSFVPGDFAEEKIPGKYDVVWVSNIIHIYSPAENKSPF